MKIYTEIPETSKPEKAWLDGDTLKVDYHKWHKEMFYYVDAHTEIPIKEIHTLRLQYGPRNGFKGMYLVHGEEFTTWELSKNHKGVITQTYRLLKGKVECKKEVI